VYRLAGATENPFLADRPVMSYRFLASLLTMCVLATSAVTAQTDDAARAATREKLRALLRERGPNFKIAFAQNQKQPFNFSGSLEQGLHNADSIEVVLGVTANETLTLSAFPHYKGDYINLDKVRNSAGLMRQLVRLSHANFLYWAADESGDVYAGFKFTLESGFPDDAIDIVLQSIKLLDPYIGEMRPNIDGSSAATK